jgi:hypothetical protein
MTSVPDARCLFFGHFSCPPICSSFENFLHICIQAGIWPFECSFDITRLSLVLFFPLLFIFFCTSSPKVAGPGGGIRNRGRWLVDVVRVTV